MDLNGNRVVVQVEATGTEISVVFNKEGRYDVIRDGVTRHPNCAAEEAMGALAFYLQSALHEVSQYQEGASRPVASAPDDAP